MIVSATGHRDLSMFDRSFLIQVASKALLKLNATLALSGGAVGWDTIFAEAAMAINLPFDLILPYKGQGEKWPEEDRKKYQLLCEKAKSVIYTAEEYHKHCFFVRDRYLVDKSNMLMAMWDGRQKGGTWYTYKYARDEKKSPILNLWDLASEYQAIARTKLLPIT